MNQRALCFFEALKYVSTLTRLAHKNLTELAIMQTEKGISRKMESWHGAERAKQEYGDKAN